jgi:hypothetical protein
MTSHRFAEMIATIISVSTDPGAASRLTYDDQSLAIGMTGMPGQFFDACASLLGHELINANDR